MSDGPPMQNDAIGLGPAPTATPETVAQPDSPKPAEDLPTPDDMRRMKKIIVYLNTGSHLVFGRPEVTVDLETHDRIMREIAVGTIDEDQFRDMLLFHHAPIEDLPPNQNPDDLFAVVSQDPVKRALIAGVVHSMMDPNIPLRAADLKEVVRQYPNPRDLENIFKYHEKFVPPQTIREFIRVAYGRRGDYAIALNFLIKDSERLGVPRGTSPRVKDNRKVVELDRDELDRLRPESMGKDVLYREKTSGH